MYAQKLLHPLHCRDACPSTDRYMDPSYLLDFGPNEKAHMGFVCVERCTLRGGPLGLWWVGR